jgi:hypothetical protein
MITYEIEFTNKLAHNITYYLYKRLTFNQISNKITNGPRDPESSGSAGAWSSSSLALNRFGEKVHFEHVGKGYGGLRHGRIDHPDSFKLSICRMDLPGPTTSVGTRTD